MKLLSLVVIIFSIYFLPCHAGDPDNVQVARSMIEAINNRDLDALDQYVSQSIVRHCAATPDVKVTNLDEFRDFLKTDFAVAPDSVQVVDVIFGSSEYVAVRARYMGTQTGAMGPFPASGKKMVIPFVGILRFAEGKVVEMWVEWDNLGALAQLGHFPTPTE